MTVKLINKNYQTVLITAIVLFAVFVIAGIELSPEDMEMQVQPWTIPLAFALLLGVILIDAIHDKITYTYVSDDTRIHKKTGQWQGHVNIWTGTSRVKGWVNLKTDNEGEKA